MTVGNDAPPAEPLVRWIKWFVTPDGRVGSRPGPPDSMMRVLPLPGFVPAGTPEEARQRVEAEAEAAGRTAA